MYDVVLRISKAVFILPMALKLMLLLLSGPVAAQQRAVGGSVVESGTEQPLPGVIVVAKDADGKRLGYTLTGADGTFSLASGASAATIEISFVGFERVVLSPPFPDPVRVVLEESRERLESAVVRESAVSVHGDTLSYLASSVRTETDRTMGDVLQRLPGIEVAHDGSILFNGRPISRLYVEGRDILRGDYNFATLNLDAKSLKSIEVYQRHQPVKALDGLVEEESAALNINLTDIAKGRWTWKLEAGGGLSDEKVDAYDASVLLGRISRSLATLNKFILNDTGALPRFNESTSTIVVGEDRFNRYKVRDYASVSTDPAPLQDRYSALNRTLAAQTVDNFTTGRYTTAGVAAKYARNTLESSLLKEQRYDMNGQGEDRRFLDVTKKHTREDYFSAAADITTNAPGHYLKEVLFFDARNTSGQGSVEGDTPLEQGLLSRKYNVNNILNARFRAGDGQAYGFNWYTQLSRDEAGYSVLTDGREQRTQSTVAYSGVSGTGLSRSRGGWTFGLTPGAYLLFRHFASSFSGLLPSALDAFTSNNDLTSLHLCPQLGGSVRRDIRSWRLSADVRAAYHFYHFSGAETWKDSFPEWSGGASVRYVGGRMEMEALWRHSSAAVSDQTVATGLVLTSWNTLWVGRRHPARQPSDQFSLNLRIQEPLTGTYFILDGGYETGQRFIRTRTVLDGYILSRESDDLSQTQSWNGGVSLSKGMAFLRGKLDVGVRFSSTSSALNQNGMLWDYDARVWSAFVRFKLSPLRNLTLSYDGVGSRSVFNIGGADGGAPAFDLRQEVSARTLLWKKLEITLEGEHLLTSMVGMTYGVFLLDAGAGIDLGRQARLWLRAVNLLGTTCYRTVSESPLLTTSSEYAIRPRTVLLGVTWNL